MTVIEFAEKRLGEELKEYSLGNDSTFDYWSAYLDGARRQKQEDEQCVLENADEVEDGMEYNEETGHGYIDIDNIRLVCEDGEIVGWYAPNNFEEVV